MDPKTNWKSALVGRADLVICLVIGKEVTGRIARFDDEVMIVEDESRAYDDDGEETTKVDVAYIPTASIVMLKDPDF